jgi:protein-disulfide isomerase
VLLTLPQLKSTYIDTGLVRYVVKDFPLSSHANATAAAGAARCAGAQGAYWPMHELLFDRQQQWSPQGAEQVTGAFAAYAEELDLDTGAFRECLDADEFGDLIRQDVWDGEQAGVRGTPSFRINGQLLRGAHHFETFQELIEAELEKTR